MTINDNGRTANAGTSHPDELMNNVSKSTMGKTLPIALGAHFLLIAVTSIGFLAECYRYETFYPTEERLRLVQVEADEKKAADRETYLKKLAEKEQSKTKKTKTPAKQPGATGGTGKSEIEKAVAEVITTRPKATIDLGDDLD